MDINKLRELIRTGEFLEDNYNVDAEKVWNKWVMDASLFLNEVDSSIRKLVHAPLYQLQTIPRDYIGNKDNQQKIMGLFRSLYNQDTSANKPIAAKSQSVFIIHGHDDDIIEDTKAVVSSLSMMPIVLREQSDKGKTIIEKLEEWLGNCKCAVILYTPCDAGRSIKDSDDEARARQNVVYEHGLFQGYLGRKRTIILRKGNTVLPGDVAGVVYTSIDDDDWQEKLKSEIEAIDKSESV